MASVVAGVAAGAKCISDLVELAEKFNKTTGWVDKLKTQHNTTVVNKTGEVIRVLLHSKHGGGMGTAERASIDRGGQKTMQTPHCDIVLYVLSRRNQEYADCWKPSKSDRSFIVKKLSNGDFDIVRSKYGHTHVEETGNM